MTNPQITFPFPFPEYSGWKVLEIKTVDSQESQSNGVLVLVGGSVTFKNNETVHTFSQSFFLAPQENGYFVLNDIFKLVAEEPHDQPCIQRLFSSNAVPVSDVAQAQSVMIEQHTTPPPAPAPPRAVEKEEALWKKRKDPESSTGQFQKVSAQGEVPANSTSIPANKSLGPSTNTEEAGSGYSVFVSNLQPNITPAQVEAEFKKFGAIKPSGVQVQSSQGGGASYAFIEFQEAASVQAAIQAAPIPMGQRQVSVRKKRSFTAITGTGTGDGFTNDATISRRGEHNSYGGRGRGGVNGTSDFANKRRVNGTSDFANKRVAGGGGSLPRK